MVFGQFKTLNLKDVFLKVINKPNLVNRFKNSYKLYNKKFKKTQSKVI